MYLREGWWRGRKLTLDIEGLSPVQLQLARLYEGTVESLIEKVMELMEDVADSLKL